MSGNMAARYAALPTAAKLLLILTAALLPIGIALVWVAGTGIQQANEALRGRTQDQVRTAARGLESLIARNALALRIAANGALSLGPQGACQRVQQTLAIAPAVAQRFSLETVDGQPLCSSFNAGTLPTMPLIAPGDIGLRVSRDQDAVVVRVGVSGGIATAVLPAEELRSSVGPTAAGLRSLSLSDGERTLDLIEDRQSRGDLTNNTAQIANGRLEVRVASNKVGITTAERVLLLLPLLMWIMAALVTWLLVTRLLIRPLKQLERAVLRVQPGEGAAVLPSRLGPAREIQQLRDAFARSLTRIESSERDMASALDGQRRLVREVHHRVKNNLQVVASLLNIHGRTASTAEARAAYAAIGRRVSALSIVHRNHFAEMEENRGIALRPLIAELAAELRAGAPENARSLSIDLDVEAVHTTQDAAVSAAFLITEVVEFAMLNRPEDSVEVVLRRTSELTARLSISSPVLVPDDTETPSKAQFERIVGGLAKQLRSDLDRRLGRYGVDLPVFPSA